MNHRLDRRHFLQTTGTVAAGLAAGAFGLPARGEEEHKHDHEHHGHRHGDEPLYKISLAEWSLHRALKSGKITNLDFPAIAKKQFGIDGVEYVNSFFKDKANDKDYLTELKQRCDDLEVHSVLIMVDNEGDLGDPDDSKRQIAVEKHHRWVEAAKFLGCHSIRVNARSKGTRDEQRDRAADGLGKLGDFADEHGLNVLVENHGGLSSDGAWLKAVMEQVGRPNVGTLPDFGNFHEYDRYQGVEDLMPFAKAVSAKSHAFDDEGNETKTDYLRMMKIVLAADYHGWVGIEWEGGKPGEMEGIRLTRDLLIKVRKELS